MLEMEKWDRYEVGGQVSETKTEVTIIEA